MDFPEFTIHDMVHAQKKLDHLGVRKLLQSWEAVWGDANFSVDCHYPSFVERGLVTGNPST